MYQRDKKDIRKIFKDANSLGFELGYDLDSLVNNHYANICMDDKHFKQELLEGYHSGRLTYLNPLIQNRLGQRQLFTSYVHLYK